MEKDFNIRRRLFEHIDWGLISDDPSTIDEVKYSIELLEDILDKERTAPAQECIIQKEEDRRHRIIYCSEDYIDRTENGDNHNVSPTDAQTQRRVFVIGSISSDLSLGVVADRQQKASEIPENINCN